MNLSSLLKELRLMKGQEGYRFCLAWLAVLAHVSLKPMIGLLTVALLLHAGGDSVAMKVVSPLVTALLRLIAR